jgi:hypothetical protein
MRVARTLSSPTSATRGRRAFIGLTFSALVLLGCDRKAPGPVECSEFAEAFVGYSREDEHTTPRGQAELDDMTHLCLTVPFDRALIACARSTHQPRACFDLYKQRTRQVP